MTKNDEESLEAITEAFIKALIRNKFEDVENYRTLAVRLANLINEEIYWITNHEDTQEMMQFWGGRTN